MNKEKPIQSSKNTHVINLRGVKYVFFDYFQRINTERTTVLVVK